MTRRDLQAVLVEAQKGEHFYWEVCDGRCDGTELIWLPTARQWIYRDNDSGIVGEVDSLILVLSADQSGLNQCADLITVEFDGGLGLWIFSCDITELGHLPEGAEVFEVGDPFDGLVEAKPPQEEMT